MAAAAPSRNGGESSSEAGIPTGLNRIKTGRASSKDHSSLNSGDSNKWYDSGSFGLSRTRMKQNQKLLRKGLVKLHSSREGLRKGKKIAQWFSSYLFKDSDQTIDDIPPDFEYRDTEGKIFDEEGPSRKLHRLGRLATGQNNSPESTWNSKMPEVLKSFSHELGPKGGVPFVRTRSHSFSDVKELLRSFRSKFDAAKELVNTELSCFKLELMEVLQKNIILSLEGQKIAEDLLILAQECVEMSSTEFRPKCETIVQDLTEKRKYCQMGLLKWLLTRMLFILTRCTRLLHFEKQSEQIDEKSLHGFKECLKRIPSFEINWLLNPEIVDAGSGYAYRKSDAKPRLQGPNQVYNLPQETWCRSGVPLNESDPTLGKDVMVVEKQLPCENPEIDVLVDIQELHQCDENILCEPDNKYGCGSVHEQELNSDSYELVMCRICEELVPTAHLESHSYICAYANKSDLKNLDVDQRLLKLAEVLEQIIESQTLSEHATYNSPENSRMQIINSAATAEGFSPKVSEWHSKGVEGMFEDLHEMDTACIEDSPLLTIVNSKGHSSMKISHCAPPSSTGSMTSASSTNTPRAGNFDFFWLEQNHTSESEDVQQMTDLVDIAQCVASTDLSEEGSHEFLLACMQDLQDVLQRSKLKALVIDTFGRRIENLLQEKYIHACELVDTDSRRSDIRHPGLLDNASQSSSMSTPTHPLHKERTSIDDFEVIKPISKGAYGKVFLARKRTTGDLFAIKVLKKVDLLRKNDMERIVAERNILITVRNPFVVRFFYSFTSRENLYLVMEYLNGGDLFSLLRNVGCLEEDIARTYVAELVLALEYLHSLGIVHRDLKPDNILVAHDGHIKLTDFGLSKIGLMNSTGDMAGPETNRIMPLDNHGQHNQQRVDRSRRSAVGTPDYLAPEILLGTEHGYAVDWWSVGVILFELITGVPPFTAEHPERIFDNILSRKVPWPPVPSSMSYEAQDLTDRFLHHDPDQRLGARGSSEVKAHPFFRGVNWDTLALQKAVFVPQPDSVDDTSYFVSRHSHSSAGMPVDQETSDSASDNSESCSNSGLENMDVCEDLAEFESSPFNLSWINFSFKNLSQLASINHDVLLQNEKDSSKTSSPQKGSNL